MSRCILGTLCAIAIVGCSSEAEVSPTTIASAQEELMFIRTTLAQQLNVPEEQLQNDVPLKELKPAMDENRLVDLVMAIEQQYDVTLPEDKLLDADEPNQHHLMLEQNTLNKLAIITYDQRHPAEVE